jgi:hypothetical protein
MNRFEFGSMGRLCGFVDNLLKLKQSQKCLMRGQCPSLHVGVHQDLIPDSPWWRKQNAPGDRHQETSCYRGRREV